MEVTIFYLSKIPKERKFFLKNYFVSVDLLFLRKDSPI